MTKMTKKQIISLFLMCSLLVSGCAANVEQTPDSTVTKSDETAIVEESSSELVEENANNSDETDNEKVLDNGSPWLDSCLKGNVTKETEVNPKDDIFLYVNKDWLLETEIPDGYSTYSWYSKVYDDNTEKMIGLLNKNEPKGHDEELVQNLYNKYLDMDARNEIGVKPLEEVFNVIQNIDSFEEINELISESEYANDLYNIVTVGVDTGLEEPDLYIGYIDSPSLLLNDSAEYEEMTEYGQIRYDYKKDEFKYIAGRLGMDAKTAEEIFDNAIEYEREFAKYIYTDEEEMASDFMDKINNYLTFDEVIGLSKNYPMEKVLDRRGLIFDGSYLYPNVEYFEHLDEFYNSEHWKKIKDLMLVDWVRGNLNDLDEDAVSKSKELYQKYFEIEGKTTKEKDAYDLVCAYLPTPASKVFIENFSSEEDRIVVEDTCYKVIDTYKEMLSENDWLSEETKNKAIEKLDSIRVNVGWPKVWDDYSKLDITGLSYMESLSKIDEYDRKLSDSRIGTHKDKDNWASGRCLIDTNAFYTWTDNSINMHVGMMGEPFYYSGMPVEELYASLGAFWIGHEISHGFDSSGSQFDKNGSYNNWWTDEDLAEFEKRVKKVDDYLDTMLVMGDYYVNGSNVDTETIADFTGLQCVMKMAEKEKDFDYKKFFEYYAKMNVSKELYQNQISLIMADTHPINYLRANIPIQQFDKFVEEYDVKPGDKMYLAPEDRILIW